MRMIGWPVLSALAGLTSSPETDSFELKVFDTSVVILWGN
jgi:hypothetical protein